jgi:DNA repair protein SbcD/Mre11
VAGDLFDSNTQPRRSVERVAAELGRLARAGIRTVIIPGTHDVYDGASIYRSYDLAAMAQADSDWVVVLTPYVSEIVFPQLDAIIYGRVFDTKRSPRSPLAGLDARSDTRATWKIGMVHGALAIPGRTDSDSVVFTDDEIARTGLDYLALGHWHSAIEGKAGVTSYAYSGAPEPVAVDQDGAGQVLIVTLDDRSGGHVVSVEARRVGLTRCEKLDLDVSGVHSQPELIDVLGRHADSNLVFDVMLTGLFPDELDLDLDEIERSLSSSFLRFRIRDVSIPSSPEGKAAPPDTVLGAFTRSIEERIAELEVGSGAAGSGPAGQSQPAGGAGADNSPASDETEELADLREVLRLGRHLLEGRQVTL